MTMGYRGRRLSPLRMILLGAVVLITAATAFLYGRRQQIPQIQAVLTSEPWSAGDIGSFALYVVPESMSNLVVTPQDLVGLVPAVNLPQGVLIPKSVLTEPSEDLGDPNATLMEIPVRHDFWPGAGPAVGDVAVFGITPGGCAVLIQELRGLEGDSVTLLVNPDTTERLAAGEGQSLFIWESPLNGWPPCDTTADEGQPLPQGDSGDQTAAEGG